MDETQWDIQEVKRLKKKQLVQYNLVMLLIFVLLGYFIENGKPSLLIGGFFVLIWTAVAVTLYALKTGRPIGTKTSRILQEFDRDRLGEKRWKRRRITEVAVISVAVILITVLAFVFLKDVNSLRLNFYSGALPFVGAWVGYNLGEITRIKKLVLEE